MTAEATNVDIKREAHRKACAYLKGLVIRNAVKNGMKWNGNPERTPEFKAGFEEDGQAGYLSDTALHIIYNLLRHNRPHTTSVERDREIINSVHAYYLDPLTEKLAEFGYDLKEVL